MDELRIFLSSPNDVKDDRDAVEQLILEFSGETEQKNGIKLVPLVWEKDALRGAGRPQDKANRLVDQCDIYIGLLGLRFGSLTGLLESGTYEEFIYAFHRWERKEPLDMRLFFKKVQVNVGELSEKDIEQIKRLNEFKQRIKDHFLPDEYETTVELKEKVKKELQSIVEAAIKDSAGGAEGRRIRRGIIAEDKILQPYRKDFADEDLDIKVRVTFKSQRGYPVSFLQQYLKAIEKEMFDWELEELEYIFTSLEKEASPENSYAELNSQMVRDACRYQIEKFKGSALVIDDKETGSIVLVGVVAGLAAWIFDKTIGMTIKEAWPKTQMHQWLLNILTKRIGRSKEVLPGRIKKGFENIETTISEQVVSSIHIQENNYLHIELDLKDDNQVPPAPSQFSKMVGWRNIGREEKITIIEGAREFKREVKDAISLINGIFCAAETDTEILYRCDAILHEIGTAKAKALSKQMFDWWPEERRFSVFRNYFISGNFWDFAKIKGGVFKMGSEGGHSDERPIHEVKLSSFQMAKYAVTVGQYRCFDPVYVEEMAKGHEGFFREANQPMVFVSWYDAYIFSKWAGCRLPSEAEWEYACRGGTKTEYYWGDNFEEKIGDNAWWKKNSEGCTHAVGGRDPNAWGLYDMIGNVWEWCQDWYSEKYYEECKGKGIVSNPFGPEGGSYRVLRGGCWWSRDPAFFRSALRVWYGPADRCVLRGFRLVRLSALKGPCSS